MGDYAHPEVLVTTEWVHTHIDDPNVRILEVDYEPSGAYELGHIRNAHLVDWKRDINDTVRRDILSRQQFERLFSRLGIGGGTTVVLYGDMRNWFAAFAYWTFAIYGAANVKLMNGGRRKWADENREWTTDVPSAGRVEYTAGDANQRLRAYLPDVKQVLGNPAYALVDVRSPAEFRGEVSAPPEYSNEGAQRAGHIPGAASIPWAQAIQDDDTFKPVDQLRELYASRGVTSDKQVIAYCRIGERSSHSWFVLKYLLGFPNVANYDGSWSEWGNAVGVPVENEAAVPVAVR